MRRLCVLLQFAFWFIAAGGHVDALEIKASVPPVPISSLTVRLADLRSGYQTVASGYTIPAGAAGRYAVDFGTLRRHGWQAGYTSLYEHPALPYASISISIDQFRSPRGAAWGWRTLQEVMLCCGSAYRLVRAPGIGAQSTGYVDEGPTGGIGVLSREGRYVVDLSIAPHDRGGSLVKLARLVASRIRARGGSAR